MIEKIYSFRAAGESTPDRKEFPEKRTAALFTRATQVGQGTNVTGLHGKSESLATTPREHSPAFTRKDPSSSPVRDKANSNLSPPLNSSGMPVAQVLAQAQVPVPVPVLPLFPLNGHFGYVVPNAAHVPHVPHVPQVPHAADAA